MNTVDISVIIPVYNESKDNIHNIGVFKEYFSQKPLSYELVIVNDGSIHNSEYLENFLLQHEDVQYIKLPQNKGKGRAVYEGILRSNGVHILFTDIDHATPIEYFDALYEHRNTHHVVIGSRHLPESTIVIPQPPFRQCVSWCARFIIGNMLLQRKIRDSQCGFKLLNRELAKHVAQVATVDRWGFDVELLAIALHNGYQIKEVPVSWRHGKFSQLKALPASWKTLLEVLKIKKNILTKRYHNHGKRI